MSTQPKNLKLTTDQREAVMDHLVKDIPYAEIIEDFKHMYPHVSESFDPEVLQDRLYSQLRKMKHESLDTVFESNSKLLIPIANP